MKTCWIAIGVAVTLAIGACGGSQNEASSADDAAGEGKTSDEDFWAKEEAKEKAAGDAAGEEGEDAANEQIAAEAATNEDAASEGGE